MSYFDRIGGTDGMKGIIGSGFYWAWFDALFMSALFVQEKGSSPMAEIGTILAFAFSLPTFALILRKTEAAQKLGNSMHVMIAFAAVGSAGSFLYILAGGIESRAVLLAGGVLCGIFMGAYNIAWGMAYCKDGARSATPLVSGAFAVAIVLDTPLLFMVPEARAVFFSLFPLASGAIFAMLQCKKPKNPASDDKTQRAIGNANAPFSAPFRPFAESLIANMLNVNDPLASDRTNPGPNADKGIRSFLHDYLGVSITLIGAVALIMSGFGYLQHLISFSSEANGIGVQVARGAAAIAMFLILLSKPEKSSAVYRVGFLVMVAGTMMLPVFFGTNMFLVAGAVIVSGYTAFDIFIWVAFSHIARNNSKSPARTVVVIRFVTNIATALGLACGILLIGAGEEMSPFALQEITVVGYLIVIAIVMLLSGEESSSLLKSTRSGSTSTIGILGAIGDPAERMNDWFASLGLTSREKDVADLLLQGRTQPWIAEALGISENTVGTHVRHIYQKASVHDRQQFLDQAILHTSPESRDPSESLMGPG